MTEEVSQWAKLTAITLANEECGRGRFTLKHLEQDWPSLMAFARFIDSVAQAVSEVDRLNSSEPRAHPREIACALSRFSKPADPLVVAAHEIVTAEFPNANAHNEWALRRTAYLGLKRGMEMAHD